MKKSIIIIFSQFILLVNATFGQNSIGLAISPSSGAECPGNWITYSVLASETPPTGCLYRWTVSNGQIEGVVGTTVEEQYGSVSVKWNDVTTPGTLTVSLASCSRTGSTSNTYTIRSINGKAPETTNGSTSTNVPFCATNASFAVKPLEYNNLPGVYVPLYEWVIPSGWKYSSSETSDGSTPYRTSH